VIALLKSRNSAALRTVASFSRAIVDVIGGQIAGLIVTAPILVPQHQGGKLRVLAITGNKRMRQLPDVPTFDELGMSEHNERSWFGLFAHRDTKPALVERIARATKQGVQGAGFTEAMGKLGFEPDYEDASAFGAIVKDRQAKWAARIRATGLLS
jgi:tripartite-type tricarboxylate transporter receptor subunit TctC